MGSDMFMNPPSREEQRALVGYGSIINLDTDRVIEKHPVKSPLPGGYRWADEVSFTSLMAAVVRMGRRVETLDPNAVARQKIAEYADQAHQAISLAASMLLDTAGALEYAATIPLTRDEILVSCTNVESAQDILSNAMECLSLARTESEKL